MRLLTAGTRASALAKTQTKDVADLILATWAGARVHTEVISTKGDRVLDKPLAEIGGKGLFTLELETALRDGAIDFAVHSLKDLPTDDPDGLTVAAVPRRASPHDAFVCPAVASLRDLPDNSRIGTSSLRRSAQLRALNPTWEIVSIRGNVQTRLRKIEEGLVDAVILAAAGLERLGMADTITETLQPEVMLPACGRGALAVQVRAGDGELIEHLDSIHCDQTAATTAAERSFLAALGGGCQVPIGAIATIDGDTLNLSGCVCSLDGTKVVRTAVAGPVAEAISLGKQAASHVMEHGAGQLIAEIH